MKVTYLANDGFLISVSDKKIIVDGLFGRGNQHSIIEVPSIDLLKKLEKAAEPFNDIDLITSSHIHWDHFDALSTIECLSNNERAFFISTEQVIDNIKENSNFNEAIKHRIISISSDNCRISTLSINDIEVKTLKLKHCPYFIKDEACGKMFDKHEKIHNLGFIYNVGGYKIYHCGDADVLNIDEYEEYELDKENIDIAFLDRAIFLTQNECITQKMMRLLKPRYLIPMHTYADERNDLSKLITKYAKDFPKVEIFSHPLESKIFE